NGTVMLALYQGVQAPRDEAEAAFVAQIQTGEAGTNPHAKVWFKYLKVIGPKRVHRLCTVAGSAEETSFEASSSSDESLD
ncbi:MAG: DUF413 domain-containing protein, partial [Aeromonas sp.]